jgi:hypothetical protein
MAVTRRMGIGLPALNRAAPAQKNFALVQCYIEI